MARYLYGDKRSEKVREFLSKVDELCLEYGLCIEHEDGGGAFVICHGLELRGWLLAAQEYQEV